MLLILCLIFMVLLLFSFTKNTIYYCGLSVFKALLSRFIIYCLFGFTWYTLLFCLVYIGGVFILFVFVSVYNSNRGFASCYNFGFLTVPALLFGFMVGWSLEFYSLVIKEYSRMFCNLREGYFYLCLCFTLLFGFMLLSLLRSLKLNYYR